MSSSGNGGAFASGAPNAVEPGNAASSLSSDYEALALEAEARIQPALTQDERERWQRLADHYWGLA